MLLDERHRGTSVLRVLGALFVLVTGAVHLEQYLGADFYDVGVSGRWSCSTSPAPAGSPWRSRRRSGGRFRETGYRPAVVITLAAEGAARIGHARPSSHSDRGRAAISTSLNSIVAPASTRRRATPT